ncbi:MAG: PLP-dependent transferase [Chloroflexi bacterium]|nr:PLP-dependent transferase [Chloroflexota bacterium]
MNASRSRAASTKLAQAGHYIDPTTGALVPPLHSASTFARDEDYELIGEFIYSRTRNPTGIEVEKLLPSSKAAARRCCLPLGWPQLPLFSKLWRPASRSWSRRSSTSGL